MYDRAGEEDASIERSQSTVLMLWLFSPSYTASGDILVLATYDKPQADWLVV